MMSLEKRGLGLRRSGGTAVSKYPQQEVGEEQPERCPQGRESPGGQTSSWLKGRTFKYSILQSLFHRILVPSWFNKCYQVK